MEFSLKHNSWFGNEPVRISLPDDWDVAYCGMAADGCPKLDREAMRARLCSPIGTKTIVELARGKKDAVIIFDDMSRGTPCGDIAELILEDLHKAGLSKKNIRFICALGSHGTCTRMDFAKKLGERIVREYAVFNHNAFQSCEYVGRTSGGIELYINAEVMRCDLKIGIGSISPHPVNGFGGGAKIALIGTAGIETIAQLHAASAKYAREKGISFVSGMGNLDHCGMRREIEEGGRIIGLDFKIDAILDSGCNIVELTAGDPVAEYNDGVRISAKLNFADKYPRDMDIVIANANVKANEAALALGISKTLLKSQGGALVLVDHTPLGQVVHQLSGASGYYTGGREFCGMADRYPAVDKVIFFTPYPDLSSAITFGDPSRITFASTWDEVMTMLAGHGAGTKAAVLSDATVMAFHCGQHV